MSLPLRIFTLALDAMPFLPTQFYTLSRLSFNIDWHWYIVHGAAANSGSTRWCQPQQPRLSNDGTTDFLSSIAGHPRITVIERALWAGGKDEMVAAALNQIIEPCILLQIDADEIWETWQIERLVEMMERNPTASHALFDCVFYVGPNLVTVTQGAYGQNLGEWKRAWRFTPGDKMRHEPPLLSSETGLALRNDETYCAGLVFHHFSYLLRNQVAYKGDFYGYGDAVFHWTRLQNHKGPWPAKLQHFLHWVDDRAMVDQLHK